MDEQALKNLPSPFYRVAIKAVVFDDQGRLLVAQNDEGQWELPGGGWEYDESMADGLQRELQEEIGVQASQISDVRCVLRSVSKQGYHVIRLAVDVKLASFDFKPGDDMVATRFVRRDEFRQLEMDPADRVFQSEIDKFWTN